MSDANRKPPMDAAESETLPCGKSMHGNRETLETPASQDAGRCRKGALPYTGHARCQGVGRSIVPKKRANKAGLMAAAESVEEGDRLRETPSEPYSRRTQGRESVAWDCGASEAAKRDKKLRFTALLHHITAEMLQDSYFEFKRMAAPGMDGVTWHAYGHDLEDA